MSYLTFFCCGFPVPAAQALDLAIRSMQFSERLQKGSPQMCPRLRICESNAAVCAFFRYCITKASTCRPKSR